MKHNVGDKLQVHCYKHNGKIHRTWDEAVVLDITEDYLVCGNCKTLVTESDGIKHKTKEPAILFFYRKRWFNIIGQLKKYGLFFYCNIATPFLTNSDKSLVFMDKKIHWHKKTLHKTQKLVKIILKHILEELIICIQTVHV